MNLLNNEFNNRKTFPYLINETQTTSIDFCQVTALYLEQSGKGIGWRSMDTKSLKEAKTRMVHVRLPEEIHKKVRIRAAEADQTIQDWVLKAIRRELKTSDVNNTADKTRK